MADIAPTCPKCKGRGVVGGETDFHYDCPWRCRDCAGTGTVIPFGPPTPTLVPGVCIAKGEVRCDTMSGEQYRVAWIWPPSTYRQGRPQQKTIELLFADGRTERRKPCGVLPDHLVERFGVMAGDAPRADRPTIPAARGRS